MSNESIKVVFPDGAEMFTVGDAFEIVGDRLHMTADAAWEEYADQKFRDKPRSTFSAEQIAAAAADAEPVICLTLYGVRGGHPYKEMGHQNATASRSIGIIVEHPHADEPDGWRTS